MKLYLTKIQGMQKTFKRFCIVKIPREENEKADHLARLGSSTENELGNSDQIIQIQQQPSIVEKVCILTIEVIPAWAGEIVSYLEKGILPRDKRKAVQLKQKATRFILVNGALFKRGFMLPLLKCISKEDGDYMLWEIHEGICGSHSGSRILAHKAVRAGFFSPSMNQDSINMVKTCDSCQHFANIIKQPPEELSSWAEAEALVNIIANNIEKFLWKSVICRYGIPHAIVTDNGKQFDCESFRDWCAGLHVRQYFSSPGHPQANGQVEATNKTIFKILKKKLDQHKWGWAESLPEVLWAYRTTKRTPTEETPFALAYETKCVIPAEVGSGSFRVDTFNSNRNGEGLKLHLDLLQEKQDQAQVTMAAYQQRVARYFN
ncbi:uncharacterized protein LOC132165945 [Corylus avellana]|uniref:uncharacterized protein LOC132165945 n=1 Tax=Corylus avellana TaxID=13451 RepID=UPI00286A06ED|nr:uncharacterized protein LOC132165945 [Corylus avellana]